MAQSHESITENHPLLRLQAALWLVATVTVVGPVRVQGPGVGVDPGWVSALSLAREAGMRFGRDVTFTYGPWGFMDSPLVISRPDFALGLSFSVASVVAAWMLIVTLLQTQLRPWRAFLAASVLTIILSSVSAPSSLLAAVGATACVCHLRQVRTLDRAWCPFAASVLAALLIQVKFPEGLTLAAFVLVASMTSPRSRWLRTAGSVLLLVVTFLALWAAAGQSVSDIGPWWRASTEFVVGYADAMYRNLVASVASVLWHAMPLLLIAFVLVLGWRRRPGVSVLSHCGAGVVMAGAMFVGLKQSFTRQDLAHNAAFFVIVTLLLCVLLARGPRLRATSLLIALSTLMASPVIFTQVMPNPVETWALTWRTFTSDASWDATLRQARDEDRRAYAMSMDMVEATRGHAVSVDPWEVSLAWAYSMRWRPMPVIQSYSAYTAYLDDVNARAARGAGNDQMIIRATTIPAEGRESAIDDRNPMWESPRYTLAAVCNYRVVTADVRWMLLRKDVNRCGEPSSPRTVREVTAGESLKVPRAAADQIVTASFQPIRPTVLTSLRAVLYKDTDPLRVAQDGQRYRLPEGLSTGPLLMALPKMSGWPGEFRGHLPVRSLTFNRPGTVQFRTIDLVR